MIDNNITRKPEGENSTKREKIKAIYPHIVVSGNIDNRYYSIQWYDIENKSMQDGYGSYTLENVRKWLKEDFEVVDYDIDNLINRQKAEIERLENTIIALVNYLDVLCIDKTDTSVVQNATELNARIRAYIKSEAVKEVVDKVVFEIVNKPSEFNAEQATTDFLNEMAHRQHEILDIIKDIVGEDG